VYSVSYCKEYSQLRLHNYILLWGCLLLCDGVSSFCKDIYYCAILYTVSCFGLIFLCASIQYIRLQGYQLLFDAYSTSFLRFFTDVQFCIESFCFGIFSADFVMYCCRISCFEDIYCLCDVYSSSYCVEYFLLGYVYRIPFCKVSLCIAMCDLGPPPSPQSPPYKFLHF